MNDLLYIPRLDWLLWLSLVAVIYLALGFGLGWVTRHLRALKAERQRQTVAARVPGRR